PGTLVYNDANTYGALGALGSGTGAAAPAVTLPNGKTYASGTIVSQGILTLQKTGALGDYSNDDPAVTTTTVLDGAQVVIDGANGNVSLTEKFNISGSGSQNTGAIYSSGGNNTIKGAITLAQNASFVPASSPPAAISIGVDP